MTGRLRRRRQGEEFQVPIRTHTGPKPGPEVMPWFWHPDQFQARGVLAPEAFTARLKEINSDLRVVFSPVHERWLVWVKEPRIQNLLCRGWKLLFLWEHPVSHEFLPLNELVFHNLFMIDGERYREARSYFEHIQKGIEDRKAELLKKHNNDREAMRKELWGSMQISTAGPGNRSAMHHSGTVVPSAGEAAWRAETRRFRLPSAQIQQEKDERERAEYGR